MLVLHSVSVVALIAALVALGPLSTDMYLPALPTMVTFFETNTDQIQLTLSSFLAGFAISQLVYGPLADRFGRKPAIVGGMLLFTLASIGCVYAQSVESLILWRFLQALGGCAGPVLGRAMIRDIYGPQDAARILSFIATAMALAPAVAPLLGGYLVIWFEWQSIFLVLAGYGALMSLFFIFKVPESLSDEHRQSFRLLPMLKNYSILLRHRRYMGYVLSCSFVYSGLFAFISGSSFVVVGYFQVPEQYFGYFFAIAVAGYMLGSFVAGRLSRRFQVNTLLMCGAVVALLAGVFMAVVVILQWYQIIPVIAPMFFYMVGVGLVMPQAMAGALAPFASMAGTASALMGFLQMSIAALTGVGVGHLHDGTPGVMLSAISAMGLLTLLSYYLLVHTGSRGDEQSG